MSWTQRVTILIGLFAVSACKRSSLSDLSATGTPDGTGHSIWDKLVASYADKRPPFPFASLVSDLKRRTKSTKGEPRTSEIIIPVSRSLPRGHATWETPRVIVAVTGDGTVRTSDSMSVVGDATTLEVSGEPVPASGRLFLGYIEAHQQMEVISWNEEEGRFEFQLVVDYQQDGKRMTSTAPRPTCTTCHQGEGPIFSTPEWDETNKHGENNRVWRTLCEAHGKSEACAKAIGNSDIQPPTYQGVPLFVFNNAIDRFHTAVETGARLVYLHRAWQGRWEMESCRKPILLRALGLARNDETARVLPANCQTPTDNSLEQVSELLIPFNPFDVRVRSALPADKRGRPLSPTFFEDAEHVLEPFSPQLRRKSMAMGGETVSSALGRLLVGTAGLEQLDMQEVERRLEDTQDGLTSFLVPRRLERQALAQAVNSGKKPDSQNPKPEPGPGDPCLSLANPDIADIGRALVIRFCVECHGPTAAGMGLPNFAESGLNSETYENTMRNLISYKHLIQKVESGFMPKRDSASGLCLERHPEIRSQLIDYLKKL